MAEMQITINGQAKQLEQGSSVRDLLEKFNLSGPVAVEINQQICPKKMHSQTILKNADVLEIVTIVGGGS
ncbi:MAG: sulfur carrier protein ThiS [Sedimentisphaerales bacterium]|nr:sulfur carrier protein ThiS [Sedimentisphaerales bacterium]